MADRNTALSTVDEGASSRAFLHQDSCDTIVHRLHRWSQVCGDRTALSFYDRDGGETALTWFELDRRVRAVAASLQGIGANGKRVVLLISPGLDYIAAFLGCLYAGVIAVPTYPPRNKRAMPQIAALSSDAQAEFVLTTGALLPELQDASSDLPELSRTHWITVDDLLNGFADDWQEPVLRDNTLAFFQYTSGSTATPRGVMLTHGCLRENFKMIAELLDMREDSRMTVWLPLYHDMGLIGATLSVLYAGGTTSLMAPTTFLQRPIRWLEAVSETRATVTAAPNFAYDLCVQKIAPEQIASLDLSTVRAAIVAAEPIWAATLERFSSAFAPCGFDTDAFYPSYGLAESTLMVTGPTVGAPTLTCKFRRRALERSVIEIADDSERDALELVGCGHTPEGLDVRIVDAHTRTVCPADKVGEIWVSGPCVANGYWNNPEETERTFNARIADTDEGPFLRTGDLGFFHQGELFIAGRVKDLIIIAGRNHHPHDIELTAQQSHDGIREVGCAAFSVASENAERLIVVAELERKVLRQHTNPPDQHSDDVPKTATVDSVVRAIRVAVAELYDLRVHRVVLVKTGAIPRTSSGKIQRGGCRIKYQNSSLGIVHVG